VIPAKYYNTDQSAQSLASKGKIIDEEIKSFEANNLLRFFSLQPSM